MWTKRRTLTTTMTSRRYRCCAAAVGVAADAVERVALQTADS